MSCSGKMIVERLSLGKGNLLSFLSFASEKSKLKSIVKITPLLVSCKRIHSLPSLKICSEAAANMHRGGMIVGRLCKKEGLSHEPVRARQSFIFYTLEVKKEEIIS